MTAPDHLDWCGDKDCGDRAHMPGYQVGYADDYPERSPGFLLGYVEGWNDAKAGRQYGEGRNGERPLLNRQDGHEGCRTAFQRDLQGLRDEVDHLRQALRRSAEALAHAREKWS